MRYSTFVLISFVRMRERQPPSDPWVHRGLYLELPHHSGVGAIPVLLLASLQLEGVAEVSQPVKPWQVLQFVSVHL